MDAEAYKIFSLGPAISGTSSGLSCLEARRQNSSLPWFLNVPGVAEDLYSESARLKFTVVFRVPLSGNAGFSTGFMRGANRIPRLEDICIDFIAANMQQ